MDAMNLGLIGHCRGRWSCLLLALASWVGLGALCVAPVAAGLELSPKIQDVRVAQRGDVTRVVIDFNRRVAFRYVALSDPPRLAIDLPEVDWLVPEGTGGQQVGLVQGFRFGRFRPGASRLVFDVERAFEVREVFELPPNEIAGHRIVAEIGPPGGPPAVARALAPEVASEDAVFVPEPPPARASNGVAAKHGTQAAALVAPRHPLPALKPAPARPRVIVIDPGHGGVDPGAIGKGGMYEKDIVLKAGLELRRQLEATGRYRVVMTRDGDSTLRLRERLEIARASQGDLFLSLHADSLVAAPDVRGAAVYTLSEDASSREAARLASKENRADILAGIDLSNQEAIVTQILIDLAQRDSNNKSIRFAEGLVHEMAAITRLSRQRRQQAGFVVLKSPDMPSALIELGYLSNASEEQLLRDRQHQANLAKAIVRAIDRYFTAESS